jgi:endonuclease/exonuclease/phosphatase family metal-dependent hydrolase
VRSTGGDGVNGQMLRDSRARLSAGLVAVGILIACLGNPRPRLDAAPPTCGALTETIVQWLRVSSAGERTSLDWWCAGVGPSVTVQASDSDVLTLPFAVVSWNTHVGSGDLDVLVADLRAGRLTAKPVRDFVLLLQETYRSSSDVPSLLEVKWASAIFGAGPRSSRIEAIHLAKQQGLSALYVPSMRNGPPGVTTEDRGNAILSTSRLYDASAIELPLERQRRVAVAGTIKVAGADGSPTTVRVVNTHFTNMVMHHAWILSESGRLRQARALVQALPSDGAMILGGDLNSWFGYRDAAYRELARTLSGASAEDRRATFGPMRLDHLLFRLPPGWRADLRRADRKYGSDHYPLVALIEPR